MWALRLGNLWKYSTAKLEARGARAKMIVRRQTSARPRAADKGTAKTKQTISKRGGSKRAQKKGHVCTAEVTQYSQGYNSSQQAQLLAMLAIREKRALESGRRASSQLATLGKLKVERKHRSSVPDAFAHVVPEGHEFTCVKVFESLLRGEFEPLYTPEGKCVRAAVPPEAAAPAGAASE